MNNSEKVQAFLQKHQLSFNEDLKQAFFESFTAEMSKGLKGEPSSLAMLPTYISVDKNIPHHKPALVIDAGGTNLRVCKVVFNDAGDAIIDSFQKFPMPGTHGELSAEVFFSLFAEYISPLLDEHQIQDIGLCFSYPTEILPNRDGRLIKWTKEVQAPEVVGQEIGKGIISHLSQHKNLNIVVLNDTVAALLAAKAEGEQHRCSSFAGFILGTGTNMATVVRDEDILKVEGPTGGHQAINLESGGFHPPSTSDIDDTFDAQTQNPGQYRFEKMVSGAYLGPLFLTCLKVACSEKLLSPQGCSTIESWEQLNTKQLNDLITNPHLDGPFAHLHEGDLEICFLLAEQLVERAAYLSALKITASIRDLKVGEHPLHPICITIDGSTVHKMKDFYGTLNGHLKKLLSQEGIHYILSHRDNAPVIGAAIAALTN